MGEHGERRPVAIFRQNLFRVSEPFITGQAEALVGFRPIYLGRRRFGPAPSGAASHAIADAGLLRGGPRIAWQMASRAAGPFLRLLGDDRPVLVHAHFGIDAVHAMPLARRLGVPLATTFHGFDATMPAAAMLRSPAWAAYPAFRGSLARGGDLFLCVSEFIRERVLAQGFPPERTVLHRTGVDCRAILPREPDEERPVLLHVARLVEMKGTAFLIDAFARLAPRHPALRLSIVGDGELRRRLERRARATGYGARIAFLGARPHAEVLALLRGAAILALPSVETATGRVEGLGMVLLEAAATGVPVVGSTVGGIPEGMRDGETGLAVPPRDAEALAAAIGRLLDDPPRRRRMGRAARRFVAAEFDRAEWGRRLEARYDAMLDRPRALEPHRPGW